MSRGRHFKSTLILFVFIILISLLIYGGAGQVTDSSSQIGVGVEGSAEEPQPSPDTSGQSSGAAAKLATAITQGQSWLATFAFMGFFAVAMLTARHTLVRSFPSLRPAAKKFHGRKPAGHPVKKVKVRTVIIPFYEEVEKFEFTFRWEDGQPPRDTRQKSGSQIRYVCANGRIVDRMAA